MGHVDYESSSVESTDVKIGLSVAGSIFALCAVICLTYQLVIHLRNKYIVSVRRKAFEGK